MLGTVSPLPALVFNAAPLAFVDAVISVIFYPIHHEDRGVYLPLCIVGVMWARASLRALSFFWNWEIYIGLEGIGVWMIRMNWGLDGYRFWDNRWLLCTLKSHYALMLGAVLHSVFAESMRQCAHLCLAMWSWGRLQRCDVDWGVAWCGIMHGLDGELLKRYP